MTVFVQSEVSLQAKEQQVIAQDCIVPYSGFSLILESDLALIAAVGRGMRRTRGNSRKDFPATGACNNANVKDDRSGFQAELNIINWR